MAKGVLPVGGELDEEGFGMEVEDAPAEGGETAEAEPEAAEGEEEAPTKRPAVAKAGNGAVKKEAMPPVRKVVEKVLGMAAPGRTDHELFVERKRTEGTLRDTACKAICRIKHGLRQPGAQEDGRPVIPENWESLYKPVLGSYIKFLLSRPDQFRIIEGSGPGFYTIEDVTSNKTVSAPVKGKDKGKGKGKFKGKGFDLKGKGKGKGKGAEAEVEDGPRDFASLKGGKDKGKFGLKGKGKGKGPTPGKGDEPAAEPPTKAAKLLAEAAREALAEDGDPFVEDDELKQEELELAAAEDAIGEEGLVEVQPEAEGEEEKPQEPEPGEEAEEDEEEAIDLPEEKEEEDPDEALVPKDNTRGSYFGLLFSGGLLGAKRPGSKLSGDAKRAR